MRTQQTLTRIAVSSYIPTLAALALALALIFSCSSGGNDEQGSKPPETGSSSEETQISSSSNVGTTESSSSNMDIDGSSSSEFVTSYHSSDSEEFSSSSLSDYSSSSLDEDSSSSAELKCNGEEYDTATKGCCNNTLFELENQRCNNNVVETKCVTGYSYEYYNPITHFCAYDGYYRYATSKCNGEEFNASIHVCCNNVLYESATYSCCNKVPFEKATQRCCGNNTIYETATQGCCYNFSTIYELANQRCNNNSEIVETKCGTGNNYYNPEVSFCVDNLLTFQKCNGEEYDPLTQGCDGGIIKIRCGTGNSYYDPETQFCDGITVVNKCNGEVFDPATQGCCASFNTIYELANQRCNNDSEIVETKCGTGNNYHNPATQFCNGNAVVNKCNGEEYDTATQFCYGSNIIMNKCNGQTYYTTQFCDGNNVVNKCGGNEYDTAIQGCCNNVLFTLSNQRCSSNVIQNKCGTGNSYANPATQFCDGNNVVNKCGGSEYNTAIQGCCNNALFTLSNQRCSNNIVETKCGTGNNYHNPATQFCLENSVANKCNGMEYDLSYQYCHNGNVDSKGEFTDSRDGKTYKTVEVGTQTWMAQNLDFADIRSSCYNNQTANCNIYGRLYNWAVAMDISSTYNSAIYNSDNSIVHRGICPKGWHLPRLEEFQILLDYIETDRGCNSSDCNAIHLKSTNGWNSNDNGQDTYGFTVLYRGSTWWSSNHERNDSFYKSAGGLRQGGISYEFDKTAELSIRCIKD